MRIGRRSFIRIAGSSAVIAAAGSGVFVSTRTPTSALAPWPAAGKGYQDPRMRALSYAILAPNPHNRQPWLADLGREGEIVLYCDPRRLLPETDPFNRQIVIGLGCFLELLRMAAARDGYRAEIHPFPDGEPARNIDGRPIARVRFRRADDVGRDPLFRYVLERRSNKEPFDTDKSVAAPALAALRRAGTRAVRIGTTNDRLAVAKLRDLTWRAHVVEMTTPRTLMESVRLMRIGKAEIVANPDGIDLGGPFLETLSLFGVLTRESLADPKSTSFAQGMDMFREIMGTAMAYVWLVTDGNSRIDQLDAGKAWIRVNLQATALGLGVHPLSQALQEYPEMSRLRAELRRKLKISGDARAQMLARVGYGSKVAPSPRWPVRSRVQSA